MIDISPFTPVLQPKVKTFVLNIHSEFGFNYDPNSDDDLNDPYKYYFQDGGIFYTAFENNKIVGTIAIKINNGIPVLKRFYVDKKSRGKGIGNELFNRAISFCKEKKFKKITLDTNNKFCKAMEMYKKKGFKTISTNNHPDCSSCACHIYMEKDL